MLMDREIAQRDWVPGMQGMLQSLEFNAPPPTVKFKKKNSAVEIKQKIWWTV